TRASTDDAKNPTYLSVPYIPRNSWVIDRRSVYFHAIRGGGSRQDPKRVIEARLSYSRRFISSRVIVAAPTMRTAPTITMMVRTDDNATELGPAARRVHSHARSTTADAIPMAA